MFNGDRARKQTPCGFRFRMPSASIIVPLTFEEFEHRVNQVVYVSATPGPYELTKFRRRGRRQMDSPNGLVNRRFEIRSVRASGRSLEEIRVRSEKKTNACW